ncbi:MAG: hypothetical protein EOO40_11195 [Deltaproteobacteria bacterium]|nr:MAG: hypothetical protein EOO40_11195 [Deltaproteobacteria bacterium]
MLNLIAGGVGPDVLWARLNLVWQYLEVQDLQRADTAAYQVPPGDMNLATCTRLARALYQGGRLEQALPWLRSLAAARQNSETLRMLVQCQMRAQDVDAAIVTYERLRQIGPLERCAARSLAGLYARKQNFRAAIPLIDVFPMECADTDVILLLAETIDQAGYKSETPKVVQMLRQLLLKLLRSSACDR